MKIQDIDNTWHSFVECKFYNTGNGFFMNTKNFTIEGWMIDALKLKGNELLLFALLYKLAGADGMTQIGVCSLMKALNVNYKTTFNVTKSLINKGFLIKENIYNQNGSRAANVYLIDKEKIRQQCGGLEGLE